MQSDFSSVSLGFPSITVTLHWKSEDMSNWTNVLFNGSYGEMGMHGMENKRAAFTLFSPSTTVVLSVFMTLLVVATVVGNAFVILAFLVEKNLRTRGNFFFLNLAIADLLVGGFCIPAYIPYVLTGKWKLGRGLCKLWLVVDYTLCTASVFNIVLISFDRYMSVTKALSYRCQKGMSRGAVQKMLSVWLAAFLLYGPAIISWEHATGESVVPDDQCHVEFYFNWYFLMTASVFEFFTPFVTVTYFNVSIYLNIRRRNLVRGDERTGDEGRVSALGRTGYEMEALGSARGRGGRGGGGVQRVFLIQTVAAESRMSRIVEHSASGPAGRFVLPADNVTDGDSGSASGSKESHGGVVDLLPLREGETVVQNPPNVPATSFCPPEQRRPSLSPRRSRSEAAAAASRLCLSRDKKVAKSLAVIVCVFGLCWAPYTLLMITRAACHSQCIQPYLYEISFWLLWLNSSINPVLYPLCHSSFRRAFSKLLCPVKIKIQPQNMEHNH
ncbi:histamine H3 receptor [Polymixia lowei]